MHRKTLLKVDADLDFLAEIPFVSFLHVSINLLPPLLRRALDNIITEGRIIQTCYI